MTTFADLHTAYSSSPSYGRWTVPAVDVTVGRVTVAADAVALLPLGVLFGALWDGATMERAVETAMVAATRAARAAGAKRDAVIQVTLNLLCAGSVTLAGRCTPTGVVLSAE